MFSLGSILNNLIDSSGVTFVHVELRECVREGGEPGLYRLRAGTGVGVWR